MLSYCNHTELLKIRNTEILFSANLENEDFKSQDTRLFVEGKGCLPVVKNDSRLKALPGKPRQLDQSLGIIPVDTCGGLDLAPQIFCPDSMTISTSVLSRSREIAIHRRPRMSEPLGQGALVKKLCGLAFKKSGKPGEIAGIFDFGDVPYVAINDGLQVLSCSADCHFTLRLIAT